MGKDKGLNPMDAYRKEQKKKEQKKHKQKRDAVREVRDLLNNPAKIEEEIQRVQKESDANRLDKSLKDRIAELRRMKEVALKKMEVGPKPSSSTTNAAVPTLPTAMAHVQPKRPEQSIYYHPSFNPSGQPPPGQPEQYRPLPVGAAPPPPPPPAPYPRPIIYNPLNPMSIPPPPPLTAFPRPVMYNPLNPGGIPPPPPPRQPHPSSAHGNLHANAHGNAPQGQSFTFANPYASANKRSRQVAVDPLDPMGRGYASASASTIASAANHRKKIKRMDEADKVAEEELPAQHQVGGNNEQSFSASSAAKDDDGSPTPAVSHTLDEHDDNHDNQDGEDHDEDDHSSQHSQQDGYDAGDLATMAVGPSLPGHGSLLAYDTTDTGPAMAFPPLPGFDALSFPPLPGYGEEPNEEEEEDGTNSGDDDDYDNDDDKHSDNGNSNHDEGKVPNAVVSMLAAYGSDEDDGSDGESDSGDKVSASPEPKVQHTSYSPATPLTLPPHLVSQPAPAIMNTDNLYATTAPPAPVAAAPVLPNAGVVKKVKVDEGIRSLVPNIVRKKVGSSNSAAVKVKHVPKPPPLAQAPIGMNAHAGPAAATAVGPAPAAAASSAEDAYLQFLSEIDALEKEATV